MGKVGRKDKWSDKTEMRGKEHGLTLLNMEIIWDFWGKQHQTMDGTSFSSSTTNPSVSVKSVLWAKAIAAFCKRKLTRPSLGFKYDLTLGINYMTNIVSSFAKLSPVCLCVFLFCWSGKMCLAVLATVSLIQV